MSVAPSIVVVDPGIPVVLLVATAHASIAARIAEDLIVLGGSVDVVVGIEQTPDLLAEAVNAATTSSLFVVCRYGDELDESILRRVFDGSGGCLHLWLTGELTHPERLVHQIGVAVHNELLVTANDGEAWTDAAADPAFDQLFSDGPALDDGPADPPSPATPAQRPNRAVSPACADPPTAARPREIVSVPPPLSVRRFPPMAALVLGVTVAVAVGVASGLAARRYFASPQSSVHPTPVAAAIPRPTVRSVAAPVALAPPTVTGHEVVAAAPLPAPPPQLPSEPAAEPVVEAAPPTGSDTPGDAPDASPPPSLLEVGLKRNEVLETGDLLVVVPDSTLRSWYDAMTFCKSRPFWGEPHWRVANRRELAVIRRQHALGDGPAWSSTRGNRDRETAYVLDPGATATSLSKSDAQALTVCVKAHP